MTLGYATYTSESDDLVIEYVCTLNRDLDHTYGSVDDIRVATVLICGIEQDVSIFDDATLKAMRALAYDLEFT